QLRRAEQSDETVGDRGDEQDQRGRYLRTHDANAPETRPDSRPGALCRISTAAGLLPALDRMDAALQIGCIDHAIAHRGRGPEAPLGLLLHRLFARRIEIHPADRTACA